MPPSALEMYPLSYPIIARLAKDIKQHSHSHSHSHSHRSSSPSISSSPSSSIPTDTGFTDHSIYVLGSNVEKIHGDILSLRKDVSTIRSDIQNIREGVDTLSRSVSDINWRLSDTKNRDWNGMVTRNYDLLKPVPRFDPARGVLVDPPAGVWPKSLGRLIRMRKSERGLLKLKILLEFYGFEGHGLWYSTGESDSESDSDSESIVSRKPTLPSLEDAVKAHPDKAMHAFCLIIGVRTEVVESNQFYHDFQALRDIILKRPAASEGSPAAAKKVRMGGGHDISNPNARNVPTTPPVRVHKRSPEFRQLIYEALQPKASPVSTVKTAETHVSWGTPEAERLRRRRELFGLADMPVKQPALPPISQQPQPQPPTPVIEHEEDAGSASSQSTSPSEDGRPTDTVDQLYEAIGINSQQSASDSVSAGVVSGDVSRLLQQNVFSIDFGSSGVVGVGVEEEELVPTVPTTAGGNDESAEVEVDSVEVQGDEFTYKSFASGTTEQDPDMHYQSS